MESCIPKILVDALLARQRILLPEIGILSLERIPGTINNHTISPPSDELQITTPNCQWDVDILSLLYDKYPDQNAHTTYAEFVQQSCPNGQILTIDSLAQIHIPNVEIMAIDPTFLETLSPGQPEYIEPLTPNTTPTQSAVTSTEEPKLQPQLNPMRPATRRINKSIPKQSKTMLWMASILIVGATLYLAYYFLGIQF